MILTCLIANPELLIELVARSNLSMWKEEYP